MPVIVLIEFKTETVVVLPAQSGTEGLSCDVSPGGCFTLLQTAVGYIVKNSADFNNFEYTDATTGLKVPFAAKENRAGGHVPGLSAILPYPAAGQLYLPLPDNLVPARRTKLKQCADLPAVG